MVISKFMYINIYEGVGGGVFSISYHHNFSSADRAPVDGQQRRVGDAPSSVHGRYRPDIIRF